MNNALFLAALVAASIAALAAGLVVQRIVRPAVARHAILLASLLLPPLLAVAAAADLGMPLPEQPPARAVTTIELGAVRTVPLKESRVPDVLVTIWIAGAMLALARITAEASRWKGIAARAEIVSDPAILRRFDSELVLARSTECTEPTVIGIVEPIVVLPAAYELDDAELDAVFAHELAHVARRDNLTALAVQFVCALFWFDPLHRIARRKLVELRERVCDEVVLERGCDPAAYVTALARSCATSLHSSAVACMSRHNLQERMESIMSHHPRRRFPAWITRSAITAVVAAAAIAFGTFAPSPSLTASELAGAYDFDVRIQPHDDGRYTLNVKIDSPSGAFSAVTVVPSAPDVRTISTSHDGRTYKVLVNLRADATAAATLEVSEGSRVLLERTKTFDQPMRRTAALPVGPGIQPPRPVYTVEPVYTPEAKLNRITGVCILELTISETGSVAEAQILKPLPQGLDRAALDAVRQWKFQPATKDGVPIAVKYNITMRFKLDDEAK